jgi:aminopeptidase
MAVCPTPAWARRVFPGLPEDESYREIRITGGGNDLVVGLSEAARFRDAETTAADGRRFLVNVPSFEVFTTPDRRRTEGVLTASRPVCLPEGTAVEGLELEFRAGRLADFRARRGAAAFGRWLDVDDGARFLGEIALVGCDSPIGESATVFEQRLLDENAAAHVAVGFGYLGALRRGEDLTAQELDEIGLNRSAVHVDVPFGTSEVDVLATMSRRGEVPLLEKGLWVLQEV